MRWLALVLLTASLVGAAEINLPPRPTNAPARAEFAGQIESLNLPEREAEIRKQFLLGNVPDFWRRFASVKIRHAEHVLEFFVSPDYLAIGPDDDYFLAPLSPVSAQLLANRIDCLLPTPKMVDAIYQAAELKLPPAPISPSEAMTTSPIFALHNSVVRKQRGEAGKPLGGFIAGHKKDVVISKRLENATNKVAIYGWHRSNGEPIQPLYLGHTAAWVDYSHGIRLVQRNALLDGKSTTIETILADPELSILLSNEGLFKQAGYLITNSFHERVYELIFERGVRVVLNEPQTLQTNKPLRLIFYALPNGNTIEQTIGRKLQPGDDWHFDIQHIGAQTRWLRQHDSNSQYVIAYFECVEKSWPAWRRKNDTNNTRISAMVDSLRARFPNSKITLAGHSGGGSFTFGYINGLKEIPHNIERIAFLDSNYAYETQHAAKFIRWLNSSNEHYLCVLAYHDSIALLNGKTFVSENGGTWGRSHAMRADLEKIIPFQSQIAGDWKRFNALSDRAQFILRENPKKEILHTRQVERNGFIHAMLTGTPFQDRGYEYFGGRAYSLHIEE